jgi:hypothetical protein
LLLLLVRREDVLRKIGKRLLLKRPPAVGSSVPVPVDREKSTEALWKEFSSRLRAFIARRIGNPADAEDILQEVFVRVHRKIGTLNEADKTAPWLFRIARNVVIDHYRSCAWTQRILWPFTIAEMCILTTETCPRLLRIMKKPSR